jgi:hypothetical protein
MMDDTGLEPPPLGTWVHHVGTSKWAEVCTHKGGSARGVCRELPERATGAPRVIAASRSLRESAESSIRTTRRELAGCGPSIPPQRLPAARNSRCRNTQRGNTRTTTARRWPKQQPGTVSRAVRTRRRTVRRPDRPRHPPRGRAPPDARSTCAGLVVGLGLCPPTLVSNTTAQGDQSVTPCNRLRYIPGRQPQDLPRRSA